MIGKKDNWRLSPNVGFFLAGLSFVFIFMGCVTTRELSITTEPGNSDIKIDGFSRGMSPVETKIEFSSEKSGYNVEIKKEGFLPKSFYLTKEYKGEYLVREDGSKQYLKVVLDPIITLLIHTDPINASVMIDGKAMGVSPVETNLEFNNEKSSYSIDINKEGFLPRSFQFDKSYKGSYLVREEKNKRTIKVPLEKFTKEIHIESDPSNANIFVNNVHVGLTPMKVRLEYGELVKNTVRVGLSGYQSITKVVPMDYRLDNIFFKLPENIERKMAYILSDVSAEDNKLKFKVYYEEAYKDTIEKSPNALQVNRIVQADDINMLLGQMAVSNDYLIFTNISPKNQINTDAYVTRVECLSRTIKGLETLLAGDLKVVPGLLDDSSLKEALTERAYSQLKSLLEAVLQDKGADNYREELKSMNDSISKSYKELIDFSQTEFYSELWAINLRENFKKSKITYADNRWIDSSPAITGDKVYFSSNRNSVDFEIWRVNVGKGSGLTRITNSPYSQDIEPSLNEKADLIAYSSLPLGAKDYQIWSISPEGILPSQLKPGKSPSLCSDKIAFNKKAPGGRYQLWIMNADGSQETLISSNSKSDEMEPSFSPDCKWIAFTSNESGNKDIWIVKADGSSRTQLTTNPSTDMYPVWGKDNNIYFVSNRGLLWGIWRLKPRLTDEEPTEKNISKPMEAAPPAKKEVAGPRKEAAAAAQAQDAASNTLHQDKPHQDKNETKEWIEKIEVKDIIK